ncbi:hypothetical protein LY78DRAFT_410459 [Colletotrichum sublineola]|nr:hypothetical protein LY78DRAFT_410459 [Colletotrichum sublineola]
MERRSWVSATDTERCRGLSSRQGWPRPREGERARLPGQWNTACGDWEPALQSHTACVGCLRPALVWVQATATGRMWFLPLVVVRAMSRGGEVPASLHISSIADTENSCRPVKRGLTGPTGRWRDARAAGHRGLSRVGAPWPTPLRATRLVGRGVSSAPDRGKAGGFASDDRMRCRLGSAYHPNGSPSLPMLFGEGMTHHGPEEKYREVDSARSSPGSRPGNE